MSDGLLDEIKPLIPKLRAYAIVLTRSVTDADDLVQDALLRAWRYRSGYTPGTNVKAWLFRILRNEFLNKVQNAGRMTEDPDGKLAAQLVSAPEQELNLRYKELMGGLASLSEDTREALLLTVGAGFTYEQAAQVCGCPIGTIKSRVNRARDALAKYIDLDRLPAKLPAVVLAI
ncbi:sigma-70 family RNA polymerase sigma factor [Phenylobacterium sp.]|uniref:sigma-70 family RNA polymerase sigma factor n=1 Tax=Phenylobacterium sp. TaxID=1871053 RepID=UPI002F94BDC5